MTSSKSTGPIGPTADAGAPASVPRRIEARHRQRAAAPFARRALFEALEQRLLLSGDPLAAAHWDGGGDGVTWQDARNWSADLLPTADHAVVIDGLGPAISFSASGVSVASLVSARGLSVSGGSLQVTGPATLGGVLLTGGSLVLDGAATTVANLDIRGGQLSGSGTVSATSSFLQSGGTQSGTGSTVVQSGASFTLDTTSQSSLLTGRTLRNESALGQWLGNQAVVLQSGASFENAGVLAVTGGGAVHANFGAVSFANTGTVRKTGGDPTQLLSAGGSLAVTHTGTLSIEAGTVRVAASSFDQRGQVAVGANALLQLSTSGSGGGDYTIESGGVVRLESGTQVLDTTGGTPQIAGPGTLAIAGGMLTVSTVVMNNVVLTGGTLVIEGANTTVAHLDIRGGQLSGSGTVSVTSSFLQSGGTQSGTGSTVVQSGASFTLDGSAQNSVLTGRTLRNESTTGRWLGNALFVMQSGASFENVGDLEVTGGGALYANSGAVEFVNTGTVRKTGGNPTQLLNAGGSLAVTNAGTLSIEAGTVQVAASSFDQRGLIDLAVGATLVVPGGFTNAQTGVIRGGGTIDLGSGGTLHNLGIIAPNAGDSDATGTLSVLGNLSATSVGTILVDLAGTAVGEYDALDVSGTLVVDAGATLRLNEVDGHSVDVGDAYRVAEFGIKSGDFVIDASFGDIYSATSSASELTLTATSNTNLRTWIGPAGGAWGTAANWSGGLVPTATQDVFIGGSVAAFTVALSSPGVQARRLQSNQNLVIAGGGALTLNGDTLIHGTLTVDGAASVVLGEARSLTIAADLVLDNGAALALGGGARLDVGDDLSLTDGSSLTVRSRSAFGTVGGLWIAEGATIDARDVVIDSTSSLNADAQGYAPGDAGVWQAHGFGPGGGGSAVSASGGGGHGGAGGSFGGAAGGASYDSQYAPTMPGSGGGDNLDNGPSGRGGYGGGAIRLLVDGVLQLDGRISAQGEAGINSEQGGGAGGAIWVTAGTLAGAGTFEADGGSGISNGSGGGGGRVAVYYGIDGGYTGYAGSSASGGSGAASGGTGTVGFFEGSGPTTTLKVYERFVIDAGTTAQYGSIEVSDAGTLVIGQDTTLQLSEDFIVEGGSAVVVGGGSTLVIGDALSLSGNSTLTAQGKSVQSTSSGVGVTVEARTV
jgi:hypothetical protein